MTSLWRERPVGVVGLGLIGGSIGLDLGAMDLEVRALVHRQGTAERGCQRGLAHRASTDPAVLDGCGLVVLALPLDRLLDPPGALLEALPRDAVVTDVGSLKAAVLARWQGLHPRFVASHPMAGTEAAGVEAGQRHLFRGRPWVVTPAADTDPEALATVRSLAEALEARWLQCDPSAHDRAVALISHLPVLVSASLLLAVDRSGGAGAADPTLVRALASSGFADTTRVGGGNPELGVLMALHNRDALLQALACYRASLGEIEGCLRREDGPALQAELERSRELRPEFL